MVMGANGRALTKSFEKWEPKAYYDTGGKIETIGWGHTKPPVKVGTVITVPQGEAFLTQDLAIAQGLVNRNCKVTLNQNQFDALTDFTFNVGYATTLFKLLNEGKYSDVPAQMMRWDQNVGTSKLGVDNRHRADIALWNKPVSTTQKTATPAKNNANTTASADAKKKADALVASNKLKAKQALDASNKAKAIQAQKVLDQAKLTKNKTAIDDAQKKLNAVNKATKVSNSIAPKQKVLTGGFTIIGLIITVIFFKYGFDL
jgi:lysozyme